LLHFSCNFAAKKRKRCAKWRQRRREVILFVLIQASGASKIDIHATQKIQADASGTSSIDCTGNPATINRNENAAASISIQ